MVRGAAGAREKQEGDGREPGEDGFSDKLDVEDAFGKELQEEGLDRPLLRVRTVARRAR